MQEEIILALAALTGLLCFVFGAFFAIRGFYRFKTWRAGEKDELWMFLSMIVGCGSLILCGIPMFLVIFGDLSSSMINSAFGVVFIGLLLGLGAIGLTTYYYFLKWWTQK
jgi:drug/metabolite transporter superfamily protein YnfA